MLLCTCLDNKKPSCNAQYLELGRYIRNSLEVGRWENITEKEEPRLKVDMFHVAVS